MVVGDSDHFALESEITHAYARKSLRALGFFLIHVAGEAYGVRLWDATMLACSLDEVARRISMRGMHTSSVLSAAESESVAIAYDRAVYREHLADELFFGMRHSEFVNLLQSRHLVWAPDGDEAFDDGSCVLQIDAGDRVRLIGFRRTMNSEPENLKEVWMTADDFYDVLKSWHVRFLKEWASLPKVAEGVQ
jgi:hypothetical protein